MHLCHKGDQKAQSFDLLLAIDTSIFYRNTFISFIILLFASFPLALKAQQSETVAIVAPMIGHSFSVGIQFKAGVTAAINALPNKKLLGKTIRIKTFDDKCNTLIAEKIANNVVNYSPVVVIGHSCSMATVKAAPIYDHHNILQITPSSTQPKVTEMGINSIFRMIGRDDIQGEIAAQRIAQRYSGKKVGVYYFPGGYSVVLAQNAIKSLQNKGVEITHSAIGLASASSYIKDIQTFINAGVEVLYLVGGGLDSGVFVRQSKQMQAPYDILSSDTIVSKVFIETAGVAGENIAFTFTPEAAELSTATEAVEAIKKTGC